MSIKPTDATVIYVEDNPDTLFMLEDLLRTLGVKYCTGRASGRQLFKLLASKPELRPELILFDPHHPYEDTEQIFAQIRATPQLAGAKILAVSANVMPEDVEKARELGFDGLIGKPIDRHRFPSQIGRILSGEAVWEPY